MNGAMAKRVTRELPKILIFGSFGSLVGFLMHGTEQSPDRGVSTPAVCSDISLGNAGSIVKGGGETKVSRPAIDENGLKSPDPDARNMAEEIAVSAEAQDLEERIQGTLQVDEAAAEQQNEQPGSDDVDSDPAERIRTMTADKQLKYIKDIADNRDDASIVELKDLILFEDEAVRHAAIDTLIDILGQQSGHYDAIKAVLAENSMFMDDEQFSTVSKIALKVEEKRKHASTEKD